MNAKLRCAEMHCNKKPAAGSLNRRDWAGAALRGKEKLRSAPPALPDRLLEILSPGWYKARPGIGQDAPPPIVSH